MSTMSLAYLDARGVSSEPHLVGESLGGWVSARLTIRATRIAC